MFEQNDYTNILVDLADGVLTVTLNRPEKANSFNNDTIRDFERLWNESRRAEEVRCIVLRAAEGKAFCTGVDIRTGWRAEDEMPAPFDYDDPGDWLGPKTNRVWKPFVVAVHGMAAGGAFYWLNEADIAICSEDATFFDPHLKFGKLSSVEPIGMLGRIPYQEISRMVLMADEERIGAETAMRISLVTEVVKREDLWDRANEIARSIAARDPVPTQGSIKALWLAQSLPRDQAIAGAVQYVQVSKGAVGVKAAGKSISQSKPWKVR
ncbi:enoyl-CoA hydratase/isomerase family protein [Croceicoccus sp. BE223]|uniref:enoyl-CoA hydratase/isomerase family protein n=1 Tax=Croceicoccus sp. BE223 TaxID=2817716 RepID=UPI0028558448|nr:enoyl-CoA hydratase/isomerase family protein [Croceicoccus sp. BE223]MDR7103705.1 enoyl-CoA hydratase/carnithine racemase [Croceicoccus sp. BE223]